MICKFCGEVDRCEVLEVCEDSILLDCCCEVSERWARFELLNLPRRDRSRWVTSATGIPCRDLLDGHRIDHGLILGEIPFSTACDFIQHHHSHCPPPRGWRWGHAVFNGEELVGVATVGRPVARMIDSTTTVEVNRLCVSASFDRLAWNACSMLYGAAARRAQREGFRKIITYTLETEPAVALRAVGWSQEALTRGGSWSRRQRARSSKSPICKKIRWGKILSAAV